MSITFSNGLEATLRRATALARVRNLSSGTAEDLLIALTEDDETAAAFTAVGVDLTRLRRDVTTLVAEHADAPAENRADAALHAPDVHDILEKAIKFARECGRDIVTTTDVLNGLIDCPAGQALRAQDVTRYDLRSYVSHGIVKTGTVAEPIVPAGETLALLLLNDDFTPMEFVVWILRDMFGMTHDEAEQIMLDTHRNGRGACGVFPRATAIDMVRRIERVARDQQHPLRCLLLPVPEPGGPQANR